MAFNINKFIGLTGLLYDSKARTFYGDFYGIQCSADLSADSKFLQMKFYVNGEAAANQTHDYNSSEFMADMTNSLSEIAKTHKKIVQKCTYEPYVIKVQVVNRTNKFENITAMMNDVLTLCREKYLISCCDKCGKNVDKEFYKINDMSTLLCAGCHDDVVSDLSMNESARAEVQSNIPLGIVGAFIGALAIFILTFIFYKLGYIVYLTGVIGGFLALFLYNKFSGKITNAGVAICIIMCVLSSVLSGVFCYAKDLSAEYRDEIADYNYYVDEYNWILTSTDEEYNQYFDKPKAELIAEYEEFIPEYGAYIDMYKGQESIVFCMVHIKEVIDAYDNSSDMFSGLIEIILWGVITTIITGLCSFKGIVNMAAGKFEVRKLG